MLFISGTIKLSETDLSSPILYSHAEWQFWFTLCNISTNQKYDHASQFAFDRGRIGIMLNHCYTNSRFSPAKRNKQGKRTRSYSRTWLCLWFLLRPASANFRPWLPRNIHLKCALSSLVGTHLNIQCPQCNHLHPIVQKTIRLWPF